MAIRDELSKAFGIQEADIRRTGAERREKAVSSAGRGASLRGVTGSLGEAVRRQAGTEQDKITQSALTDLSLGRAKAAISAAEQEEAKKEREEIARQQMLSNIFAGLGGVAGKLFPDGLNFNKQATAE